MNHTSRLAAKVEAKNKVNARALAITGAYLAAIAPFVGQQIYKADGDFLKKFKAALPEGVPGDYFFPSRYNLVRVVRDHAEVNGSYSETQEASVYLGKCDGPILTELYQPMPENFRTDYTVEEIVQARKALTEAKRAVSAAESALCGFGEYDR